MDKEDVAHVYNGILVIKKNEVMGSPGGSVVKNPPVNAGGMGAIPGPRGSHMPWSN